MSTVKEILQNQGLVHILYKGNYIMMCDIIQKITQFLILFWRLAKC